MKNICNNCKTEYDIFSVEDEEIILTGNEKFYIPAYFNDKIIANFKCTKCGSLNLVSLDY